MANRSFNDVQALDREIKYLFLKAAIGGSGAPTINTTDSVGIASIARNGAGDYTVTLSDQYVDTVRDFGAWLTDTTARDFTFQIHTDSVGTSNKTLRFLCNTAATPTELPNGATLNVKIGMKNSSVI